MATTGTLMTDKNIYGLVNPPTDPSSNSPFAHQTINSGAVRWDNHVDLSNAAVRVTTNQTIAGDKTFTGTILAPTPVESDNTTKLATTSWVNTAIDNLVDGAPNSLNTLNELAAAINDDNNFNTTMTTALAGKHASITTSARLNANLIHDGTISNAEFGYLNGVTSAIQTQIDGKQASLTSAGSGSVITATERTNLTDVSNNAVRVTGNQTIAGDKSFTGIITCSTPVVDVSNSQIATTGFVKIAVNNLVDSAPGALNTLNELAAALGDDANYAATITTALAGKHASITTSARLNANLIHDGTISNAEFGYLNGVTSAIQTQIDGKQASLTSAGSGSVITATERTNLTDVSNNAVRVTGNQTIAGDKSFTGIITCSTPVVDVSNSQIATTGFVKIAVNNLVDSAPGALNTLNELAAALGDDANYAATITTALAGKHASITTSARLNANLIHDGTISNAEFGYLNGVTSAIQTQIDTKQVNIISTSDISMNNLWVQGDISCNGGIEFKGHILPLANETYDIGSANRKIRHLYLSTNSLWIGDDHKIDITGGKMKFKKRKKDGVPASIIAASGNSTAALAYSGVGNLSDMTLQHWKEYGSTLNVGGKGVGNASVEDIFVGGTSTDWEVDDALDDDLTIARTTGLQAALDAKQATITDSSLTIARTTGLQAALDAKQATITSSTDISLNNLWAEGDISCNSVLKVDTINENTDTSGVTIDSVLLKDNTVTAHTVSAQNYSVGGTNFISASRQGNFRDLEVKDSGNSATILLTGDGGHISIDGTLSADTIGEKTSATGVTIDSVLLKDNIVTAHTISAQNYSVGGTNFISASRQGNFRDLEVKNSSNSATILLTGDGGDISIDGTLSADTISEKTSAIGVTIDGVLLKDNDISANDISSNNLYVDTINERTSASGVTIDGVLLKDNNVTCTDLTASGTTSVTTQSAGDNTTKIASTAFVKTSIDNLVSSAPGALDTLNELAAAIGDDANYAATVTTALASKQASITTLARLNANLIHDGSISNTEFGYLNGVTSAIQTQIDTKQATLTAGTNITITGSTISASGGGGGSVWSGSGDIYYTAGNVGIGAVNPSYPLEVVGYAASGSITGTATMHAGGSYFYSNHTNANNVSIKTQYGIWASGGNIMVSSDERIKESIVDVPDDLALQMVRDIPCRYYQYKDKISRGKEKTIGFIAQEVAEVLPMAISIQKDIIPNEMRILTDISWNGNTLHTDLQDVSGVKYRFYVSNDVSGNDEIKTEIIGNSDNTFTFDSSYNNVFIYGKEVDDFHTLDKNKLFALNFSATQELDRQQQTDKARITVLETKVESQDTLIQTLISRIEALENN